MSSDTLKPRNSSFGVLKLVELYSGIGGMRYAFEASGIPYEIVAAIDINTVVNGIYCSNFGRKNHMQRNIESLTTEEIECMKSDVIVMSPPCQPFTRLGLKMDSQDPRSKSFLHFLNIFSELKKKPSYLMFENVMGFEVSEARNLLISTLEKCGFTYQEFLLTPSQFGIPNSRLRYYLIAKLSPLEFCFTITKEVKREWPVLNNMCLWKNNVDNCSCPELPTKQEHVSQIKYFLEDQPSEYFENFLLPDKVLAKHANVLDIVNDHSFGSCCFTKGYSHYIQGSGSVLNPSHKASELSSVYEKVTEITDKDCRLRLLKSLELRYFTPREIANIMCFPKMFCFPDCVTVKQKYKALGNSVNVFVVSRLLQLLITET